MDYTIVDFNKLFTKKMKDVKILEKIKPKQAIPLWVEIIDLMIRFSKSSNCPRDLKRKLILQAEKFVAKVKLLKSGHIKSVFDNFNSASAQDSSPETQDKNKGFSEEEMLDTLQQLPETPSFIDVGESPVSPNFDEAIEGPDVGLPGPSNESFTPSPDNQIDHPVGQDSLSTSLDQDLVQQGDKESLDSTQSTIPPEIPEEKNVDSQIQKGTEPGFTLDSLRQKPDFITEVEPTPFDNQSIITPHVEDDSTDLEMYKKETMTLDITKLNEDLQNIKADLPNLSVNKDKPQSTTPFKIVDKIQDPFKPLPSTTERDTATSPHDPFGPTEATKKEIDDVISEGSDETMQKDLPPNCFACGQALKPNDPICPFCGTDNAF